ncbi:MAG: PAS domain S-box protein, partial [Guyparkeria sp.]
MTVRRHGRWPAGAAPYGWLPASVVAVVLLAAWAGLVYLQYQDRIAALLAESQRQQANAIEVLEESYTLAARNVFEQSIDTPGMRQLLARAHEDAASRDAVRAELAERLGLVYEGLRDHHFRQLPFHLADGTTLYRFHRPEKYADDVAVHRPGIRLAQQERRKVSGFEAGRNFHGFRNVFPLVHEGELIGSVELSVRFSALREVLEGDRSEGKRNLFLLMRRDVVLPKLFEDRHAGYEEAPLHPEYVIETMSSSARSDRVQRLGERFRRDGSSVRLDGGAAGWAWEEDGAFRELLFLPLSDPMGEHAAYLVIDKPAPGLAEERDAALRNFLVGALPLVLAMMLLWRLMLSRSIREAEAEQLRRISECMGEGLYVLDREGRIRLVNDRAVQLLDMPRDQLIGKQAHPLFHARHGEDGSRDVCPIQRHASAGESYHSRDERFRRRNGDEFPVEVTATPLTAHNRVVGAVTIFRDISDQLETERRLREQEALFRTVFEASGVGVALLDDQRRVRRANDALVELLGRGREALLGLRIEDLVEPGDRERLVADCEAMECGRRAESRGEYRYRAGDDDMIWVQQNVSRLCGLERSSETFVVLLTDITSRKRYERLLKHERRQMDRVLHSAGEGIIGVDADGRAVFVNAAAERISGYDAAEFKRRDLHDLLHHHHGDGTPYPREDCPIQAALRDGRERRVQDDVFWRADGQPVPVEYVVGPIEHDEAGGAVVVFQDITERRRMEA